MVNSKRNSLFIRRWFDVQNLDEAIEKALKKFPECQFEECVEEKTNSKIKIGTYITKYENTTTKYIVNEIFIKTAHVDVIFWSNETPERRSWSFSRRYPLWLIEQQILKPLGKLVEYSNTTQ